MLHASWPVVGWPAESTLVELMMPVNAAASRSMTYTVDSPNRKWTFFPAALGKYPFIDTWWESSGTIAP